MKNRLSLPAVLAAGLVLLLPAAAYAQAPKAGQGHSKMRFSPVKAKFSGGAGSFSSGASFTSRPRLSGIHFQKFHGTKFRSPNDRAQPVRFNAVKLNGQTNIRKSNFAASRNNIRFQKPAYVKTVSPARFRGVSGTGR